MVSFFYKKETFKIHDFIKEVDFQGVRMSNFFGWMGGKIQMKQEKLPSSLGPVSGGLISFVT